MDRTQKQRMEFTVFDQRIQARFEELARMERTDLERLVAGFLPKMSKVWLIVVALENEFSQRELAEWNKHRARFGAPAGGR